jgi:hypothetical protein
VKKKKKKPELEETFENHSDSLMFRIYKKLLQLSNKKSNRSNLKMGRMFEIGVFSEKVYKCQSAHEKMIGSISHHRNTIKTRGNTTSHSLVAVIFKNKHVSKDLQNWSSHALLVRT